MSNGYTAEKIRQGGKLVTIVIPVFNTEEPYLRNCLRSLSEVPRGLFEVIIVDDGSPDEYHHWMSGLIDGFSLDCRVVWRENGGQNAARLAGIGLARGDYLFFLDSDDYIDPRAFEECCGYLIEHEPDILAFNICKVDSTGQVLDVQDYWKSGCAPTKKDELLLRSDSLCRQMYRRELLLNVRNSLVTDVRIGEDMSSAVLIALSASRIYSTGAMVYWYVQRPSSMLHNPHGHVDDIKRAMDAVLNRADSAALVTYREEIEWLAILHVLYFGGMRSLCNAKYNSEVQAFYFDWMSERFPKWRSNRYLALRLQRKGNPAFRLIVRGHWRFYRVALGVKRLIGNAKSGLTPSGARQ